MASNRRSAGLNRPTHVEPTAVSVLSTATGARLDLIGTVPADAAVSGVSLRAQDIVAGDLFAALPGCLLYTSDAADE